VRISLGKLARFCGKEGFSMCARRVKLLHDALV
jgi:hypothetical protein